MTSFFAFLNKIRPEKFFLFTSVFFGLCFLFLTPPFQVPDEPNHFYRAWQISQGGLISSKYNQRVGGILPQSLENIVQPFNYMIGAKDKKLRDMAMSSLLKIELKDDETKFYDFNNTALYSPVCYAPASLAIFLFKHVANPMVVFYMARLFLLLTWIGAIFFAIKQIPFYKWLFAFLTLLPMSMFINMSINADVITNATCFLFIATVLNLAYGSERIDKKRIIQLCALVFLLVSVKSVYAVFLFLLILIPKKKFQNTKDYLIKLSLPVLTGVVFFILWSSLLNPLYLSYENYNGTYRDRAALVNGADMQKQLHHILHGGNYFKDVLFKTLDDTFNMYFEGYIGMFGWLELHLAHPFIVFMYLLIIFLALCNGDQIIRIPIRHKLIFGATFTLMLLLVILSQLLIWCYIGADVVLNMQGRYFIPFMPLLFILFYNRFFVSQKLSAAVSIISIVISLIYCVDVLYTRYH